MLRAAPNKRPLDLPPELADVYRFTRAVVEAAGADEALRRRIRDLHGEEGLVGTALVMQQHGCPRWRSEL